MIEEVSTQKAELSPETCREALKSVIDPELYHNIIDLGLVYEVKVLPEKAVQVTMTYTTPMCPMGPQIKENVEKTLRAIGANSVSVDVVFEPRWTANRMSEALQRTLGMLDEPTEEEEVILLPPPQKKGFLSRLFGR